MSEERIKVYSLEDRTVKSPTGTRYVLTNSLMNELGIEPSSLRKSFSDLKQFIQFQGMIHLTGNYGRRNITDKSGSYVKLYKLRDEPSEEGEILLGSFDAFNGFEEVVDISQEKVRAEEESNYLTNVCEGASSKDTREINLNGLLENERAGTDTRTLRLREFTKQRSQGQ